MALSSATVIVFGLARLACSLSPFVERGYLCILGERSLSTLLRRAEFRAISEEHDFC